MSESIELWSNHLERFVSKALSDFLESATEQMEQFAIDCHPWNGSVILAFCTTGEVEESPILAKTEEMAAWKLYDFASARHSTHANVGKLMQDMYNQHADKAKCADLFLHTCADVLTRKQVQAILSRYKLSPQFKITVTHPDTGKEYYAQNTI